MQLQLAPSGNRFGFSLQAQRNACTPQQAVEVKAAQNTADRLNGILERYEGLAGHIADLDGNPSFDFNELPGKVAVADLKVCERFGNIVRPEVAAFVEFTPGRRDMRVDQAELQMDGQPVFKMERNGDAVTSLSIYSPQDDSYYLIAPNTAGLGEVQRRDARVH